uniref:Uncharacterized protein n=1 Tax=Arundo donax TaxID=35708 RepID=A0A0A9EQ74_ARUDO
MKLRDDLERLKKIRSRLLYPSLLVATITSPWLVNIAVCSMSLV